MTILYLPSEIIKKIAKKKQLEKLITDDFKVNRLALKSAAAMGVLSQNKIEQVALKVAKNYKKKYNKEVREGVSKARAKKESLNKKKQIVQRVQNSTVYEISEEIKERYYGESYEWLPSDADEPDPQHQLLYGTIRKVGVGEMPGQRYGCKCGMRILTRDETLLL